MACVGAEFSQPSTQFHCSVDADGKVRERYPRHDESFGKLEAGGQGRMDLVFSLAINTTQTTAA